MIATDYQEIFECRYRVAVVCDGARHTVAGTDDYDEATKLMRHITDMVNLHNHPYLPVADQSALDVVRQDFLTIGDYSVNMGAISSVYISSYEVGDEPPTVCEPPAPEAGPAEPYDLVKGFYAVDGTDGTPTVSDMPMDDVVQE